MIKSPKKVTFSNPEYTIYIYSNSNKKQCINSFITYPIIYFNKKNII